MARPFQKIGLERFSFRRRRSVSSSSSPLSLASDGTDGSTMEAAAPSTRRILSRSCGSKGSRLSVDLPPPLAGGPSDKGAAGSSSSQAVPPRPARHEGPPSDAEMVKEKFSKLLLGEDMSGTGKGVSSALALSNAITNLAASVFGEQRRLQPMAADQKARWQKEIDWLLSVADHIVEFVPSQQMSDNGICMEIMVTQQRQDLQMNIPALRKLDGMLLEYLDSFKDRQEFWYVSKDADELEKGNMPRQDDKWWLPTVRVPPNGLSDAYRKWLQHQKDLVAQVLKAAMAINANILMEMEVPESYMESLPKNGKSTLGESMYKLITDDYFDPEELLSSVDLSDEHNIVDLKNRVEASVVIWQKKMTNKDSKLSWGHGVSHEKRGMFEGRAENVLLLIKHRYPGIAQSTLDISKIQCNRDVGLAILESYSRTLESLAFTVMSRIEDVLNVDLATQDPKNVDSMRIPSLTSDDTDKVVSDARAEVEKSRRMEPVTATMYDFVSSRDHVKESANGPKLSKISSIATKRFSYLDNLGGTRSPIARH
ncbi:rho guanine nucleotide exchange factor 8-like [Panicum miliaceum]|uniref:Rho guanine nucleotide exchange factor 8-like n=1 Tax=Panicum miliaceum TaxID=4540 RepID=A0A3L6RCC7_PANMI|nr:rho guanine nucleotide exchange factor 8-like [Panicum miliaceum]